MKHARFSILVDRGRMVADGGVLTTGRVVSIMTVESLGFARLCIAERTHGTQIDF